MTNLAQKNPFSIYDFFGYLFPGLFVVLMILVFYSADKITFDSVMRVFTENKDWFSSVSVLKMTSLIVISYIVGHVLAYVSSITIERFSLWLWGYPSEFLMNQRSDTSYWESNVSPCGTNKVSLNVEDGKIGKTIYFYLLKLIIRFCMGLFLLPISLIYLMSKSINLDGFITRSLDPIMINWVNDKVIALTKIMSIEIPDKHDLDYSRIIYHYYLHQRNATFMQKTDNFVALYGFLRSVTLAFNLITLYIVTDSIIHENLLNNIVLIIGFAISTFVLFLAFMKFYRRYSLEIFMFVVSDTKIKV